MYFLKTRYYDPTVGRFISMDDVAYIDPETIGGLNLFAYCNNNPVMNVDPNGRIGVAAVVAIVLGAATLVTGIGEVVAYLNAEKVYEQYKDTIKIENGVIYNSNQVKNPFHMWALSSYVTHYTDSGVKGSSYGLFVEWICHNIGGWIGIEGGQDLNFGKTILSDFENHNTWPKVMLPIIMNAVELITSPIFYIYDIVRTIW